MLLTEHIFQIVALLSSIFAWGYIRPTYLRTIIFILALTVVNESLIEPYIDKTKITSNDLGYNIFSFFDMAVWLYIFYRIHKESKLANYIIVLAICLFAYTLYDIYFNTTWYKLHILSMMAYSFSIIVLAVIYLYKVLTLRFHNLGNNPLFWMVAACVIYHSLLFYNFFTLTSYEYWKWANADFVYDLIQLLDNIFYYGLLTVTFVICIYYKQEPSLK